MTALVWPVATYGCKSWTLRKNEEARLDAFEMKGHEKDSAGVKRKLLDTVKARKLAYCGHTMRK